MADLENLMSLWQEYFVLLYYCQLLYEFLCLISLPLITLLFSSGVFLYILHFFEECSNQWVQDVSCGPGTICYSDHGVIYGVLNSQDSLLL